MEAPLEETRQKKTTKVSDLFGQSLGETWISRVTTFPLSTGIIPCPCFQVSKATIFPVDSDFETLRWWSYHIPSWFQTYQFQRFSWNLPLLCLCTHITVYIYIYRYIICIFALYTHMRSIGYLPNSFVLHSLRFWQGLEMFNHETAQGPQALPQEEEVWRKLGMMRWIYGISSYDWEGNNATLNFWRNF